MDFEEHVIRSLADIKKAHKDFYETNAAQNIMLAEHDGRFKVMDEKLRNGILKTVGLGIIALMTAIMKIVYDVVIK